MLTDPVIDARSDRSRHTTGSRQYMTIGAMYLPVIAGFVIGVALLVASPSPRSPRRSPSPTP